MSVEVDHVFRVAPQSLDELLGLLLAYAHLVNGGEQRKLILHIFVLQHKIDLGRGLGTLEKKI